MSACECDRCGGGGVTGLLGKCGGVTRISVGVTGVFEEGVEESVGGCVTSLCGRVTGLLL
jgi:hypothetical protein